MIQKTSRHTHENQKKNMFQSFVSEGKEFWNHSLRHQISKYETDRFSKGEKKEKRA